MSQLNKFENLYKSFSSLGPEMTHTNKFRLFLQLLSEIVFRFGDWVSILPTARKNDA